MLPCKGSCQRPKALTEGFPHRSFNLPPHVRLRTAPRPLCVKGAGLALARSGGLFRASIRCIDPVTASGLSNRSTKNSALRGHDLSSREERPWRKTRQRTHGSLETPSLCGYRLRLDVSVPSTCALVPSPNSNQRRCSRASSGLHSVGSCNAPPWKLMNERTFSSTGSPPLRAYCLTAVECRNCNRNNARFHLSAFLFLLYSIFFPPASPVSGAVSCAD